MMKQIIIPVAAFAVTATAASAFNADMLEQIDVDLTDSQVSALETVHELRIDGADRATIMEYLADNDLDQDTMKEIHEAVREVRDTTRAAVEIALENDDYAAFSEAIANTPLADAIASEADFDTFKSAHDLKEAGDHEAAQELMAELGIDKPADHGHRGGHGFGFGKGEDRGERAGD